MIILKVCGRIQTLNHQRMLKILTCLFFGLISFLPLKPVVSLYRKKVVGFPFSTLSTNMVIGSSLAVYAALNLLISNSIYGLGQSNNPEQSADGVDLQVAWLPVAPDWFRNVGLGQKWEKGAHTPAVLTIMRFGTVCEHTTRLTCSHECLCMFVNGHLL